MLSPYTDDTLDEVERAIEVHGCDHDEHDHKPIGVWTGEILARLSEIQFNTDDGLRQHDLLIELAAIAVMFAETLERTQTRRNEAGASPYRCLTCGAGFGFAMMFEEHRRRFEPD